MDGQEEPQRDQQDAPDQPRCCALGHRGELYVGKGDIAGDAHAGFSRFDEFEIARDVANGPCRRPTRLEARVVEPGLHQYKFVTAAKVSQLAAEEAHP